MSLPQPSRVNAPKSEFQVRVEAIAPGLERAEKVRTVMLNVTMQCNLACETCHHRCSPARTESMSHAVMIDALTFAAQMNVELLDVTGGEPTMWPLITDLLHIAGGGFPRVRVRTNLSALLLPEQKRVVPALAGARAEVLASLPESLEGRTLTECISALKMLRDAGYGDPATGAIPLDLAYNPLPGELPRPQRQIEAEFRSALAEQGIPFRSLIAIGNVALGGFGDWLDENGEGEAYRSELVDHFNPAVLPQLVCRHSIEVAWDGTLWDCDFNLAARRPLAEGSSRVSDYVGNPVAQLVLDSRHIAFGGHCLICSAGDGAG